MADLQSWSFPTHIRKWQSPTCGARKLSFSTVLGTEGLLELASLVSAVWGPQLWCGRTGQRCGPVGTAEQPCLLPSSQQARRPTEGGSAQFTAVGGGRERQCPHERVTVSPVSSNILPLSADELGDMLLAHTVQWRWQEVTR